MEPSELQSRVPGNLWTSNPLYLKHLVTSRTFWKPLDFELSLLGNLWKPLNFEPSGLETSGNLWNSLDLETSANLWNPLDLETFVNLWNPLDFEPSGLGNIWNPLGPWKKRSMPYWTSLFCAQRMDPHFVLLKYKLN